MNRLDFVVDSSGLPEDIREMIEGMLQEHGRVHVLIRPARERRSVEQNKLFSLYCRRMALQAGTGFEDMKEIVKSYAVDMGYPVATGDDGEILTRADGSLLPLPSHEADVAEFGVLLDAAQQFAYEHNLQIE